jgi:hypothetical protein
VQRSSGRTQNRRIRVGLVAVRREKHRSLLK